MTHTVIGAWHIREWEEGDAAALAGYLGNESVSMNLVARHPRPYTEKHAKAWIDLVRIEADPVDFAIANDEEAIGGLSLQLQRGARSRAAEIGYWVGEPHWGQGIATLAVRSFVEYAFSRFKLMRIAANVFDGNPASVRVLEKAGFIFEGRLSKSVVKDGRVLDELIFAAVR